MIQFCKIACTETSSPLQCTYLNGTIEPVQTGAISLAELLDSDLMGGLTKEVLEEECDGLNAWVSPKFIR